MSPKVKASRPYMPEYGLLDEKSGKGLLPWTWARDKLMVASYYWISTVRREGRPHCMPVWAIFVDDVLYFSTGRKSRKAKNLQLNPNIAVSVQWGDDSVILEGIAVEMKSKTLIKSLSREYEKKYRMALDPKMGPVYSVRPAVVFGLAGVTRGDLTRDFAGTATRWIFEE